MKTGKISQWTPKMISERTGVSVPALHFYEGKGLIMAMRTPSNQRRYDGSMIRRIAFIQAGQKVGITLAEIKKILDKLPQNRTPTRQDWKNISTHWQETLNTRILKMERMRDNLSNCIRCGCLSMDSCALYNPEDINAGHPNNLEQ